MLLWVLLQVSRKHYQDSLYCRQEKVVGETSVLQTIEYIKKTNFDDFANSAFVYFKHN